MRFFNILCFIFLFGCGSNEASLEATVNVEDSDEILVDSSGGIYKEWYPGKQQIKYLGNLDHEGKRHGKWSFYLTSGMEKSMTTYTHGSREGFSIVKHENGLIFYRGEWFRDKKVGIWTTYDSKGAVVSEINYSKE